MSTLKEIRENLRAQILELEVLQSVYPKELTIADQGNLADINEFISGNNNDSLPQRLEYSIEISVPEGSVELRVSLPFDYPTGRPEVYARSSTLDRNQQTTMNEDLNDYATTQEPDEPCIYSLITWIQDNFGTYAGGAKKKVKKKPVAVKRQMIRNRLIFARYWVYSHHIFCNLKRKDIADEARENSLTGFCLAGKPGIICVEGTKDDCEYWWQKIKVMNWHKILVKLIEEEDERVDNIEIYRKFTDFREISFPTSDKHNDMGQLLKYLMEHRCQHVFKELFGFEGKTSISD